MLLTLSGGSLFAQREATGPRPRRGARAPDATSAIHPPAAKPRTEPPRQADDAAAPAAAVRGAVRGPAGEPASGATVWLVVRDGEKVAEPIATSSGDNGQSRTVALVRAGLGGY